MADASDRNADGYRQRAQGGPSIRADVVDVYVFRRADHALQLLQLRRAKDPLRTTWQPVMGHVEGPETALECARRESREEIGLDVASPACLGFWALEQVHPFFVHQIDAVVLSPRFVCEVAPDWEPRLNDEHDAARWTNAADAERAFLWPGQRAAVREILTDIADPESPSRAWLAAPRTSG